MKEEQATEVLAQTIEAAGYPSAIKSAAHIRRGVQNEPVGSAKAVKAMLAYAAERETAAEKLAEALTEAREMLLSFNNARWSESECTDAELVASIDAALAVYKEQTK